MHIIAFNEWHNTRRTLRVKLNTISARRIKQLRRELCATTCNCFDDWTTYTDAQTGEKLHTVENNNGSLLLWKW